MDISDEEKESRPQKKLPKGASRKAKNERPQSTRAPAPPSKDADLKGKSLSPLEDGEIATETPLRGKAGSSSAVDAIGASPTSPRGSGGVKRVAKGDHEPRPSPMQRQRQGSAGGSSSVNGVAPRPNPLPKKSDLGADPLKAEKALAAYRKRKEKTNDSSMFIKRR